MARILTVVLIFFSLCTEVWAQQFPLIIGQEYGFSAKESVELSPGVFASVATVKTTVEAPIEHRLAFFCFDENGNVISNSIVSDEHIHAKSLAIASDGNLVVLGAKVIDSDNLYPIVFKLTNQGAVIWEATYPYHTDFVPVDLEILQNDEYAILATNSDSNFADRDVLIFCSDSGDTIWTQEYLAFESEYSQQLRRDNDGDLLIVGVGLLDVFSNLIGYLRKVSVQDGETLWRHTLQAPDTSYSFNDVAVIDGNYLIVGQRNPDIGSGDGLVHVISESNDVIWSSTFGGDESDTFQSVAHMENGDVVVAGRSQSFDDDDFDIYVVRLDDDYGTSWEQNYGGDESEGGGVTCLVTNSQKVLLTGNSRSFNSENDQEAYILMIDSIGNVVTTLEEVWFQQRQINIFPNPVRNNQELNINSSIPMLSVELFDVEGRLLSIKHLSYQNDRTSFRLKHRLSTGQYTLRIHFHEGASSHRFGVK